MEKRDETYAGLKVWILWAALTLALSVSGVLVRLWLADLDRRLDDQDSQIATLRDHIDEFVRYTNTRIDTNTRIITSLEEANRRAQQDRIDMETRLRAACRALRVC